MAWCDEEWVILRDYRGEQPVARPLSQGREGKRGGRGLGPLAAGCRRVFQGECKSQRQNPGAHWGAWYDAFSPPLTLNPLSLPPRVCVDVCVWICTCL